MITLIGVKELPVVNMDDKCLIRVFTKGGVISPGDLLKIIQVAKQSGTNHLHFGSRQDVLLGIPPGKLPKLRESLGKEIDFDLNDDVRQNIVSSYVALDVMPSKKWLAPHIYHYILDTFDYNPTIRINIVDPSQSLVPLFTGKINFIASDYDNYWYLYLRFEELSARVWSLPILIYGYDLHRVSREIERLYKLYALDLEKLFPELIQSMKINTQPVTKELTFPKSNFPYYEGINRISEGKYWLGIYWRNNNFDIRVLRAVCKLCQATNIGKISLTPWKSIIVKTILEKDRILWEKLMGQFGMNMRHSSLELNWHLPALDEEALSLKKFLVRELDKIDISTSGLTFTIKSDRDITVFTSVVIEKSLQSKHREIPTYNVLYSKDFNPNHTEYYPFAKDIRKEIIPLILVELSHKYYEQLEKKENNPAKEIDTHTTNNTSYQCSNCLTIYDEKIGDPTNGIEPGVSFKKLPNSFGCPLCGSPKSGFRPIG